MNNKLNRSDFPPAIGTIEIHRKGDDGRSTTTEVPIIETYEFRGELFGVHLDLDYFEALAGVDSDDIDAPGEYTVTHVGTGINVTDLNWGSIEYVKLIAAKHWRKYNFYDFYERAKRKGYAPVRGTVLPIEVKGK